MAKTLQDLVPANARKKLGSGSKLNVLSSHDVFRVIKDEKLIIMACNTRIKHVIPGIMRVMIWSKKRGETKLIASSSATAPTPMTSR